MKGGKERKENEEGGRQREKREEGLVAGRRGERHVFDCK